MTSPQAGTRKRATALLDELIKPLPAATYECDTTWDRLEGAVSRIAENYGELEMNPDFQRGHVWTDEQVAFIQNCLRNVVSSAGLLIQFNCASWDDFEGASIQGLPRGLQCVDGLQRYTAITRFMKGEIRPFGLEVSQFQGTQYNPNNRKLRLAIHAIPTKEALLKLYLDLNSGGTVHSNEELERVRQMLEEAKA
ncbi:MAG: hypothetical protein CMK74_03735 [Pseudomonadales bacterium]|nr:hypothetical protein [Pseudomonadales bacterium]|tara:strand:+ start:1828 stop:2412 length:585 start_codon:yes stop_codon:yes gene_type:complete